MNGASLQSSAATARALEDKQNLKRSVQAAFDGKILTLVTLSQWYYFSTIFEIPDPSFINRSWVSPISGSPYTLATTISCHLREIFSATILHHKELYCGLSIIDAVEVVSVHTPTTTTAAS